MSIFDNFSLFSGGFIASVTIFCVCLFGLMLCKIWKSITEEKEKDQNENDDLTVRYGCGCQGSTRMQCSQCGIQYVRGVECYDNIRNHEAEVPNFDIEAQRSYSAENERRQVIAVNCHDRGSTNDYWNRLKRAFSRTKRKLSENASPEYTDDDTKHHKPLSRVTWEDIKSAREISHQEGKGGYQMPRRGDDVPDIHPQGCDCSLCRRKEQYFRNDRRQKLRTKSFRPCNPRALLSEATAEILRNRENQRIQNSFNRKDAVSRLGYSDGSVRFERDEGKSVMEQIEKRFRLSEECDVCSESTEIESVETKMENIFKCIRLYAKEKVQQDILDKARATGCTTPTSVNSSIN